MDGIADVAIEIGKVVGIAFFVVGVDVHLVDDEDGGHAIGFGSGKEAVDECGGRGGVRHGEDEHHLVEVAGKDVGLLRQVARTADDVVASRLDAVDEGEPFAIHLVVDHIAHCHGIGGADALEAEVALHLAGHEAVGHGMPVVEPRLCKTQ